MSVEGAHGLQHERLTNAEKEREKGLESGRRSQALEAAVRTHSVQGHQVTGANFTADDVIASARKYYDFLKGGS